MKKLAAKLWAVLMLMLVSMQTMATDTFTSNRTDFRDESIYFMMTTRFYDGDTGNNVLCWDNQSEQIKTKDPCWRGDFQGVIDKLDYIKALGFTAIWITPVVQNASGYDYHGYHAMDFSKVDCRYQSGDGSKSGDVMFQELINKAHDKGIKIILDIVLNHTGNFGEQTLCKEFDRNTDLETQALINACMIPNEEKLGSDYLTSVPYEQYQRRLGLLKNVRGKNEDVHNYWHHFGDFNWDLPNRWWAQIAGDCVDLNTENNTVADYLVKCYGNFIKMGVDGFRIDTSGHISRLTFCKQFIPQFAALGKQYEDKRLNKAPFFMYGEVCARFGSVQYRGQDNLSPYYYTWKAPKDLLDVSAFGFSHRSTWFRVQFPDFQLQGIKRFALLLFLTALLFAEEDFAERHEHDDADGDDDDAHREEAEEGKRLITALGQYFIDNQVGRRTDEGEHSAQTSGKGERHEKTRRLHARACSYAHDDRHHEGHRSGIAHEGADKGGYEHYEQEGDGFVAARERHELIARKLGKSGLHDSSTHHEESYHHDDDGRRKARQRLGRCQDTQNQECCQGGKRHDVGPHPAPDE